MDRNERLRQVAHQLWLDEGRPDGRAGDHWRTAEQMSAGLYDDDGAVSAPPIEDLPQGPAAELLARVNGRLTRLREQSIQIREEILGLQAIRARLIEMRQSRAKPR